MSTKLLCLKLLEIISDSRLESDTWAGWESAAEHSESELQVFRKAVPASNLRYQLAASHIEVVGHSAKQFRTEAQPWRKLTH